MKAAAAIVIILALAGCYYPEWNADPWSVQLGMTQEEVLDCLYGLHPSGKTITDGMEVWHYYSEWSYWSFTFVAGVVTRITYIQY